MSRESAAFITCDLCREAIGGRPALTLPLGISMRTAYIDVCAQCMSRPVSDLAAVTSPEHRA